LSSERSDTEAAGVPVISSVNRDCLRGPSRGLVPVGVPKGDGTQREEGVGSGSRTSPAARSLPAGSAMVVLWKSSPKDGLLVVVKEPKRLGGSDMAGRNQEDGPGVSEKRA
jgi:hypothetical protein